jgi:DNA-binding NtrC family response regulator
MGNDITVAVLNSSVDTIDMLKTRLNQCGFPSVVGAHVYDFRTGDADIYAFLEQHDPRVLIYDIAIPYEENWRFLQELLAAKAMAGRRVIVTTTNKNVLESMVGPTRAFEVHGKPYDIDLIVSAVERAVDAERREADSAKQP